MATTLHSRIESAIRTAQRWEDDRALLAEIRASIPLRELVPELISEVEALWQQGSHLKNDDDDDDGGDGGGEGGDNGSNIRYMVSCFKEDDADWEGDDLLLKRLTVYFKREVMAWCNQP